MTLKELLTAHVLPKKIYTVFPWFCLGYSALFSSMWLTKESSVLVIALVIYSLNVLRMRAAYK